MARLDPRRIAIRKLRRGFRRINTDGLYAHFNTDYFGKGIGDLRSSVFIHGWMEGARAADRGDPAPDPSDGTQNRRPAGAPTHQPNICE